MVAFAVNGRRESQSDRANAPVGEAQGKLLAPTSGSIHTDVRAGVALGQAAAVAEYRKAGCEQERAVRAGEHIPEAPVIFTKPAREYTGNSVLCEDVLVESGVTDLSNYDCVPGSELGVDLWVETPNPPGYTGP